MKTFPTLLCLMLCAGACRAADANPPIEAPGQSIVSMFERRDAAALNALFDADALLERVLQGTELPAATRTGFATGFKRSITQSGTLLMKNAETSHIVPRLVRSTAQPYGSTQIVRFAMHDDAGEPSGYDYVEFELGADGRIRDWRSHAQAAWTSDTMRMLAASLFDNSSLLNALFGRTTTNKEVLDAMTELSAALKRQDTRGAHAALAKLPDEFKKTRQWACMRAALAAQFDEQQYRADLDIVAAEHGEDPQVQFMLIDYYFYQKKYEPMAQAIQRFERRVVADGATNQLECTAYVLLERYAEAETACRDGIRLEPSFEHGWWTLVDVFAHSRDATKLLATIDEIEPRFKKHMDPGKLAALEGYEWLAQDKSFKAWAKRRR